MEWGSPLLTLRGPAEALANALSRIEELEGSLAICERAHRRHETAAVTEPEQELCHETVPLDNEMSRKPLADLTAWSPEREAAIDPVLAAARVKPWPPEGSAERQPPAGDLGAQVSRCLWGVLAIQGDAVRPLVDSA